jgi:outer membrane protein TolC
VERISIIFLFLISTVVTAQIKQDTLPTTVTISDCVNYALTNYPVLKQSLLDEDINRSDIRIALSGWWPQINSSAVYQHYLKQPTSFFPNLNDPSGPKQLVTTGVINSSTVQFGATQNIYNTELLFAVKTAHNLKYLASENTQNTKINVVVNVSKAFYDVLLSEQQINVLKEDIQRLERNYTDARNRFNVGISDKTDYQRASLALNNARAQHKSSEEGLKVKYAYLKQLMGFPVENTLKISFDSSSVEKEILLDTTAIVKYDNRIEYQTLQTNQKLQSARVGYYRWSFLPSISAFGQYNLVYQNDQLPPLFNKNYPNSLIGLNVSLPIFQGTSRLQNIQKAKFQYKRTELDIDNLKRQINTEYTQALATYKSNLNEFYLDQANIKIATNIFDIIKSQYNQGIKTYLDVIIAETDLRTAQLNYLNALFVVLSSSLDVKKALGNITVK